MAVWVDRKLKEDAVIQKSYIASSKDFKDYLLESMPFPPTAQLFTADAVSYYTMINTQQALREIGNYLRQNKDRFRGIPIDALLVGLRLVITYNVFTFGDTHWIQLSGTAMCIPPQYITMLLYSSPYTKI